MNCGLWKYFSVTRFVFCEIINFVKILNMTKIYCDLEIAAPESVTKSSQYLNQSVTLKMFLCTLIQKV